MINVQKISHRAGLIVGIVMGCVLAVSLVGVVCFFVGKKKSRYAKFDEEEQSTEK